MKPRLVLDKTNLAKCLKDHGFFRLNRIEGEDDINRQEQKHEEIHDAEANDLACVKCFNLDLPDFLQL